MTTLADLVERTKAHLYTETRDEKNRLSAAIDVDDIVLSVDFPLQGIQRGAKLAIGLEEFHVWESTGSSVTVSRAQNGTVAAAHAQGADILVNPKVSSAQIVAAINDDLMDLSAQGLYAIRTVDVTYDAGTAGYNLSGVTDLIDILSVNFDERDGTERHLALDRTQWRLLRNQSSSEFASGLALMVNGYVRSGETMRIAYKAPFTPFTALSNNVTTSGLPTTAYDLPPLGAALNLSVGTEVARNWLTQSDTRRADEVGPGARLNAWRGIALRRQQRIAAEVARLYAANPVVKQ